MNNYIDAWYLISILLVGRIMTNDQVIDPLPFRIKAIMLRIGTAWRILILSFFMGFGIYLIRYYTNQCDLMGVKKLVFTYFVANSFYELFAKYLFSFVETWLAKRSTAKP